MTGEQWDFQRVTVETYLACQLFLRLLAGLVSLVTAGHVD